MNMPAPGQSAVTFTQKGAVATITLAQPANHNAFSMALVHELNAALDRANALPSVSVILLLAEGPNFSAGGDLRAMAKLPDKAPEQIEAEGRPIADLFKRLADAPKPVVAAVQGSALGGGCGLACAATITLAADTARFGCTELRLGLFPFLIMPALRNAVGDRLALELALSARMVDAREAAALGMVTRVVPAADLAREARETAGRIGSFSPNALRLGLRAFRDSSGMTQADAIDCNLAIRTQCCAHEDVREGATAFLEKRPARWQEGKTT